MEWEPAWFARWPHTWDGGPHDWQISAEAARARLAAGEDLVTAWSSGGVPHTVLTLRANGTGTLQHAPLPERERVYRLGLDEGALAVLPALGSRDPLVVYEPWSRHGAVASRHTGDIRERLLTASPLPGPPATDVARLREWDPTDVLPALVATLPTWVAEAEALTWSEHVSDARERRDAVVARVGADDRTAALLPPPPRRGFLGRRKPGSDRWEMPLEVGSHDLEKLLAATGRTFKVERSDKSRVLRAPVPDGEVVLAVTVKAHAGLKLAVTGFLVHLAGTSAAWTVPGRDQVEGAELTERQAPALPDLLALAVEVFDGFVAEFQEPVDQSLVPVTVVAPY